MQEAFLESGGMWTHTLPFFVLMQLTGLKVWNQTTVVYYNMCVLSVLSVSCTCFFTCYIL